MRRHCKEGQGGGWQFEPADPFRAPPVGNSQSAPAPTEVMRALSCRRAFLLFLLPFPCAPAASATAPFGFRDVDAFHWRAGLKQEDSDESESDATPESPT